MTEPNPQRFENTRLAVDALAAKNEIEKQIAKGKELYKLLPAVLFSGGWLTEASLGPRSKANECVQNGQKWRQENANLLRLIFTDRTVENEYLSVSPEFDEKFPSDIKVSKKLMTNYNLGIAFCISYLEQLIQRFPELVVHLCKGQRKMTGSGQSLVVQRLLFLPNILYPLGNRTTPEFISDRDNLAPIPSFDTNSRDVFLVHGRNNELKETVARFVEQLDLKPIILHEQASAGRTIIEKFEDHSNARFAIILLTPDDVGCLGPADVGNTLYERARQNVIFEWGFFIAKLGRKNVCALAISGIELPSDLNGILTLPVDERGAWKMSLVQELKAAGITVDLNEAFA